MGFVLGLCNNKITMQWRHYLNFVSHFLHPTYIYIYMCVCMVKSQRDKFIRKNIKQVDMSVRLSVVIRSQSYMYSLFFRSLYSPYPHRMSSPDFLLSPKIAQYLSLLAALAHLVRNWNRKSPYITTYHLHLSFNVYAHKARSTSHCRL
jgi:hypothetical protein